MLRVEGLFKLTTFIYFLPLPSYALRSYWSGSAMSDKLCLQGHCSADSDLSHLTQQITYYTELASIRFGKCVARHLE